MKKIKICAVVASRANYARIKYVLLALKENPDVELQLIVGASTLLYRFGKAIDVIVKDGFNPLRKLYYVIEGETLTTQAKSTGLGIIELSSAFEELQPDAVITVADRFETMATAIAATYQNIPLIHLQGGEVSGNIDDRVRHAITKLADYHFVATEESKKRVIHMGTDPAKVFNFGCPSIDVLTHIDLKIDNQIMKNYGGTGKIDWGKPYVLMMQHPVTTTYGSGYFEVTETLSALKDFTQYQKVVLWPNIDAGTDDISKAIRVFREKNKEDNFSFFRNFSPEDYARILNNCTCAIGNSSSFIREGSFLGTPVVMVGGRQENREHGKNITSCDYQKETMILKIKQQIKHGKYQSETLFGDGNAGKQISKKISVLFIT